MLKAPYIFLQVSLSLYNLPPLGKALHTDNPTWGARQMSSQLKQRGYKVGRRKARKFMDEMDINPIYPKPNLSKRLKQAQVVPYLLRNAVIERANKTWMEKAVGLITS